MILQKKIYLKDYYFNKTNFLKLVNTIFNLKANNKGTIDIQLDFEDNTQINEKDNINIFDNLYVEEKELKSVNIKYRNEKYTNEIKCYISNEEYATSFISIESNNENWYLATLKQIEERLLSIPKKSKILKVVTSLWFTTTISAILSFTVLVILNHFKFFNKDDDSLLWAIVLLLMFINTKVLNSFFKVFNIDNVKLNNKERKHDKFKRYFIYLVSFIIIQLILPFFINILSNLFFN